MCNKACKNGLAGALKPPVCCALNTVLARLNPYFGASFFQRIYESRTHGNLRELVHRITHLAIVTRLFG